MKTTPDNTSGHAFAAPGAPNRGAGARSTGGAGPRAVASLVPAITRKAFEKHGFAAASLITDWARIVGADLARLTRPERLKWPRAVEKFADTAETESGRPGATLTLRVDPAAALDVQYRKAQILERINAYFGYRAVCELRLIQAGSDEEFGDAAETARASAARASSPRTTPSRATPSTSANLSGIDDDALRAALERLAASIAKG